MTRERDDAPDNVIEMPSALDTDGASSASDTDCGMQRTALVTQLMKMQIAVSARALAVLYPRDVARRMSVEAALGALSVDIQKEGGDEPSA